MGHLDGPDSHKAMTPGLYIYSPSYVSFYCIKVPQAPVVPSLNSGRYNPIFQAVEPAVASLIPSLSLTCLVSPPLSL